MRKITIAFTITLAMAATAIATRYGIAAQSQLPNDSSTSQVLINEIRELRRALNDYIVISSRTQITLERLKFQQLRVNHLSNEKENLQMQVEETVASYQQMEEVVKSLERQLATEVDPARRVEVEREHKNTTTVVEQHKKREQHLRERYSQAAAQLQTEGSILSELQSGLEKLEKAFDSKGSERK